MIRTLLVAALLAAPLPALAQMGAEPQGPTGGAAEEVTVAPAEVRGQVNTERQATTGDPNRRVCRKSSSIGSRIASAKVCKSAREWENQRQASKSELDRTQRQTGTNF